MFVVLSRSDGAVVGHLGASGHGEGWGSNGDAFQFTDEVAGVRWLVVAHRLPHHALTVLVVVPQCVVAPFGRYVCSIYAYIFIIACTCDDFLSPVAQHIACCRWCVLRPVAVGGSVSREHDGSVGLEHAGCSLTRAGSVESFLQQVTVPVDAEIIGEATRPTGNHLIAYARDGARLRAVANGTGIVV